MITFERTEDRNHFIVIWRKASRGPEYLTNAAGVQVEHVTRCVSGELTIRFRKLRAVDMGPGDEIILPEGVPYQVEVHTDLAEVRCFYPKSDTRAREDVESIEHTGEGDGDVKTSRFSTREATFPRNSADGDGSGGGDTRTR